MIYDAPPAEPNFYRPYCGGWRRPYFRSPQDAAAWDRGWLGFFPGDDGPAPAPKTPYSAGWWAAFAEWDQRQWESIDDAWEFAVGDDVDD